MEKNSSIELKNHKIGNQKIYRLHYVYLNCHKSAYTRRKLIEYISLPQKPFTLPNGMSREDAFKVLSYLTDYIERRDDVDPCSAKSVKILDSVLNLERFGFKKVEENNKNEIIDLFTVTGDLLMFKNSDLYNKYFEWYTENVTKEEVEEIYKNIGIEFKDIIWLDRENKELVGPQRKLVPNKKIN